MTIPKPIETKHLFRTTLLCLLQLCLLSCALLKPKDNTSDRLNDGEVIQSIFKHKVLSSNKNPETSNLTVFISGDGKPWLDGKHIAKDPTGESGLILDLMKKYNGQSLYIGRPCYHQVKDPKCDFRYWTSHRYGQTVLNSIKNIIKAEIIVRGIDKLILVGHSGGGAIVSLIACEFALPTRLLTISANLDTDAWTAHHNWTPLNGSMNPALDTKPCPQVIEQHFHGSKDEQVPVFLNAAYYSRHGIKPAIIANATHANWIRFWPIIQNAINLATLK